MIQLLPLRKITSDSSYFMRENTIMIKNMVKEFLPGPVAMCIKEIIRMMRERVMEK